MGVVGILLPFYRCLFHKVSFLEKLPSASHDDVITRLGFIGFTGRLKTTPPSTVSEYIMLFTDGSAVLIELKKLKINISRSVLIL